MPCGWEGNRRFWRRRTGHASQTSVVYPATGSRPRHREMSTRHGAWHSFTFPLLDMAMRLLPSLTLEFNDNTYSGIE